MNNLPIKAIEIPSWWRELDNTEEKYRKEMTKLIGSNGETIQKEKDAMKDLPQEERKLRMLEFALIMRRRMKEGKIKEPFQEIINRIQLLGKILKGLSDYKWGRFRLENINNDFGTAEHLYFDEDKNIIEIKEK